MGSESWDPAILDSGASRTVCGKAWLDDYLSNLSSDQRNRVHSEPSQSIFRFGDGNRLQSSSRVNIPAVINNKQISITTDVVDSTTTIILTGGDMQKGNMQIDFQSDTAEVFGDRLNLITTKSGHYALPITQNTQLFNLLMPNQTS